MKGSTSTAQSRKILLLDTCVVLHACRLGIWGSLTANRRIAVPESVVGEIVLQLREEEFDGVSLDIEREVEDGKVEQPSLLASELKIVRQLSGPEFRGAWDDGELECVACLLHEKYAGSLVCSSDAVVFRFLGWTRQNGKGISLEEVLKDLGGPRRQLLDRLTRRYREYWTKRGFQEAFQSGVITP